MRWIVLFYYNLFMGNYLQGLFVKADDHFRNGINMSIWGTNYAWGKLREKVKRKYGGQNM